MPTVGATRAQRDVFERITVDAGIRTGHLDAASAILRVRTALHGSDADTFAETRRARIDTARRAAHHGAE